MKIFKIFVLKYIEKVLVFLCNFWWFKDIIDIICKDGVGCIMYGLLVRFDFMKIFYLWLIVNLVYIL